MAKVTGKQVLVTGAGGFIGSHLVEALVEHGATVRAFVHYNALGRRGWLDESPVANRIEIVAGDITDRDSVVAATKGVAVVFHLAALIAIPYSYRAPESYIKTNVLGTMNVLHACRESGVERLVHTSTSEVYGTAQELPITERHPLRAQSPYAASKTGADQMVGAWVNSYGIPAVTLRPFNTYGPRQSARAIIPTIICQCLSGARTIKLGNLKPTRDLVFVSDTAAGMIAAAEAENTVGQTVHLGTGRETSIGDLAETIIKLTGASAKAETVTERGRPEASEVSRLVADSRKAAELLGWRPQTDLETGLKTSIEWFRAHLPLYRPDEYTL